MQVTLLQKLTRLGPVDNVLKDKAPAERTVASMDAKTTFLSIELLLSIKPDYCLTAADASLPLPAMR